DLALLLGAEPRDRGAMLLGVREETLGLARESRLRVGDQLTLALLEPCELGRETLAQALEVLRPGAQLPLELLLRCDQPAGQLREDALLGPNDLVAPLLRQPAMLFGQLGGRLRALERDRPLELLLARRDLGVDDRAQSRLRARQELVFGFASPPHRRSIVGQTPGG